MPYQIRKQNGKFCVVNKATGAVEKCHPTKEKAQAHMAALYVNVEEAKTMNEESMIYFGGEVKALDDKGKVGGYLVRFTDKTRKDLSGEFFTSQSYLGPKDGDGAESLFDHGFPIPVPTNVEPTTKSQLLALADHTFAPLKTRRDAVGIWAEVVLNLANDYEKHVYGLVQKKKLGWSSGAAGHRVRKNADGEITAWPIAEGSLTPCPCEPLNRAISLKSLGAIKFVSLDDEDEDATKATWSAAFMNDLPDSSFLVIESGGEKDDGGKTTPRSLRHFPYKDADGKVDLPHLRNALARIPQSKISQGLKDKALRKARSAAKEAGIQVTEPKRFGECIEQLISDREEDGQERDRIIKNLATAAFLRPDDVETIITGKQRPANAIIKAFARVLEVDYDLLRDLADKGTPKTIKSLYSEELASRSPSTWELESAMRCVIKKIAEAATASAAAGGEYDWQGPVKETMKEYIAALTPLVVEQVQAWVAGDYDGDEFYLKHGIVTDGLLVTGGLDFEEHSALVVTALSEIVKRFRDNSELRIKAGRVLSEKNRARLSKLVTQMMTAVTECQNLLEETKPMASDMEKNIAYVNHLRVKHTLLRNQIGV